MQSSAILLIVALTAGTCVQAQILNNLVLGNTIPNTPSQALSAYTPTQIQDAVDYILALGVLGQNSLLTAIAQGVTINTGPLGFANNISLGAVTLPPGYLCSDKSITNDVANLTLVTSCYVCSADCTWVHNKYGGFCGLQTNNASNQYQTGSVCVCGDSQNGNIKTPYQQCGPLLEDTPQTVNDIAGILISNALLARENVQCVATTSSTPGSVVSYNSAACQVDCQTNHQYSCGICDNEIPVPQTVGQTNTQQQAYCGCYYGAPTGANGTQCASS